jgi:hypothetical protein
MGIHISIHERAKLLFVQGEAPFTSHDIETYYDQLKAHKGVGKCHKALIDLTGSGVNFKEIRIAAIRSLGIRFREKPLLPAGTRMAIVVTSKLAYGFTRVFMASRDSSEITIKPFLDMESAMQWLEIIDADIDNTK